MDIDLDSESRRNRFTGALDCVRDLVIGLPTGSTPDPGPLGALLDLLAAEAHQLYDEPECSLRHAYNDRE